MSRLIRHPDYPGAYLRCVGGPAHGGWLFIADDEERIEFARGTYVRVPESTDPLNRLVEEPFLRWEDV